LLEPFRLGIDGDVDMSGFMVVSLELYHEWSTRLSIRIGIYGRYRRRGSAIITVQDAMLLYLLELKNTPTCLLKHARKYFYPTPVGI
jgi:hypothetical protein